MVFTVALNRALWEGILGLVALLINKECTDAWYDRSSRSWHRYILFLLGKGLLEK